MKETELKQIKEMAKLIDEVGEFIITESNEVFIKAKVACDRVAEQLYNADYRKQSEYRQELIEAFDNYISEMTISKWGTKDECETARAAVRMAVAFVLGELPNNAGYRKQSEWISVEERLPEIEQIVLCCLGVVQNVYTYKGDNTWEDSYGYYQKDEPITHWMPLPEPPKMKGGAE